MYPQEATQAGSSLRPRPESPTDEALSHLQGHLQHLHERISSLEHRLERVMSPAPPEGSGKDKVCAEPFRLHEVIHGYAEGVNIAARRVVNILERLEI